MQFFRYLKDYISKTENRTEKNSTDFQIYRVNFGEDKMIPMALRPHLLSGSNTYHEHTVINEHVEGIKPFAPAYMNTPSGLPVC